MFFRMLLLLLQVYCLPSHGFVLRNETGFTILVVGEHCISIKPGKSSIISGDFFILSQDGEFLGEYLDWEWKNHDGSRIRFADEGRGCIKNLPFLEIHACRFLEREWCSGPKIAFTYRQVPVKPW